MNRIKKLLPILLAFTLTFVWCSAEETTSEQPDPPLTGETLIVHELEPSVIRTVRLGEEESAETVDEPAEAEPENADAEPGVSEGGLETVTDAGALTGETGQSTAESAGENGETEGPSGTAVLIGAAVALLAAVASVIVFRRGGVLDRSGETDMDYESDEDADSDIGGDDDGESGGVSDVPEETDGDGTEEGQ